MLLPVSVLLLVMALLGPNVLLASCSILILVIGSFLLWRPLEPPVLLLIFVFQWTQASLHIFLGALTREPIGSGYFTADPTYATWLAMIGLLFISIGIRVAAGPLRRNNALVVRQQIRHIPQLRFFKIYLVAVAVALLAPLISDAVPGLRQPLQVAVALKWAAYVIFTVATFSKPHASRSLWLLVFIVEFAQGLGGYFSNFKLVLIYTLLGIMAAGYRPGPFRLAGAVLLVVVTLLLGSVWSHIKQDYRTYVNAGKATQQVATSYIDSLSKIVELTGRMDTRDLQNGFKKMASRISYIGFFSAATKYVPSRLPHTGGSILLDAVSRPLMPRLFFPDKSVIDESALVRKYTGIQVAGMRQGVSISLGFYGDSYVDFGIYGMVFGLLAWGLFIGFAYRWLMYGRYSRGILGYGLASAVMYQAFGIEVSSSKLFGGMVTALLVLWVFSRFVVPRYLAWLRPAPTSLAVQQSHE